MINTIFHHELLNLYRERLAIILVVATCCLTLLGLFNGQQQVNKQLQTIQQIEQEQRTAILNAQEQLNQRAIQQTPLKWWDDVTDVRGYAFYLMVDYAVKPPANLAPLAIGQSDIYPYFFRMTVDTKQAVLQEKNTDHPLLRYVGQFDLAFFLVFVLPLLLITINFNAIAQEREREQLKLLVIQGLTPARLLLLQLAVRTGVVILPILLITGCWLAYFSFNRSLQENGTNGNEIAAIQITAVLLMIIAYSLFWVALTAWCISKGKTAAHNATFLIACWLLLAIAIPMISNTLINMLAPLPSRVIYIDALRKATDNVERESEKALAGFLQDHPELAKNSASGTYDYAVVKIAKIDAIEESMRAIEQDFTAQLDAQQKIAGGLKWLSPASLFYQTIISASGNGLAQQRAFLEQVESHHQYLRRYFQEKIIAANERGDFTVCENCKPVITFQEFDQQPRFTFNTHATQASNSLLFILITLNILVLPLVFNAGTRLNKMVEAAQ